MSVTLSIASRDFKGFFGTPLGWIAACIFFLVSGIVFFIVVQLLLVRGQAMDPASDILGQIIGFLNYINIFVIPAFTMRVMSEEFGNGTYRLQASAPISTWEIVAGKFLGILFYFGILGFFLLLYPLFTIIFTQIDLKILLSGWIGLMLNTASIVAISLFISSLTKNPVLSYLGSSFSIILFIFSSYMPGVPAWYKQSVNLLDLGTDLTRGLVKTNSLAIYFAIIFVFLFLSRFVLESRKWRV
jgi:ABC-2 type transport system permease protein